MSGELAPFHPLTSEDRGPIVIIVGYFWACLTTLLLAVRVLLSSHYKFDFKIDDLAIIAGSASAISASVLFHLAVNHGLGRHIDKLSARNIDLYFKMTYIGQVLAILAMSAAKLSAVYFTDVVAPRNRLPFRIMLFTMVAWTLFSLFGVLFQCQMPQPWVLIPSECSTHGVIYYPIVVLNMVTDTALAIWILPVFWNLNAVRAERFTAIFLFGSRIIVPFIAIGQIIAIREYLRSSDQTWSGFGRALWDLYVLILKMLKHNSFKWASWETS